MTDLLKRFRRWVSHCSCCGYPGGPARNRIEFYRAAKKRERQAVREEIEAELMELGAEGERR